VDNQGEQGPKVEKKNREKKHFMKVVGPAARGLSGAERTKEPDDKGTKREDRGGYKIRRRSANPVLETTIQAVWR